MRMFKKWIGYLLVSVPAGFCVGFILYFVWRVLLLLLFGYHDSGPMWMNIGSYVLIFSGICVGVVVGHKMFYTEISKEMMIAFLILFSNHGDMIKMGSGFYCW